MGLPRKSHCLQRALRYPSGLCPSRSPWLTESCETPHVRKWTPHPILSGFSVEWQEGLGKFLKQNKTKNKNGRQASKLTSLPIVSLSTGSCVFTASIEKFMEDMSAGSRNSRRRVCVFAASTH